MKQIPLTQGKVALVDDKDFDWLSQYNWVALHHPNIYYAVRWQRSETRGAPDVIMHREIMGLTKGDGLQIDHKNCNGLDNRRCNLRLCTYAQNQYNRRPNKNTSSIFKGVSWFKNGGKWQVAIKKNGKRTFLGLFDDEIEAALAYNQKAKELFGEFAKLNNVS